MIDDNCGTFLQSQKSLHSLPVSRSSISVAVPGWAGREWGGRGLEMGLFGAEWPRLIMSHIIDIIGMMYAVTYIKPFETCF